MKTNIDNTSFIKQDGDIKAGDWFCSKWRTEHKFFFFVNVKEVTKDGYICKETGVTYPLNDPLYRACLKNELYKMEYKDELTIRLKQYGIEPTEEIIRFIDLETIPLKAEIMNYKGVLSDYIKLDDTLFHPFQPYLFKATEANKSIWNDCKSINIAKLKNIYNG